LIFISLEQSRAAYRAALARGPGLFEPYLNLGRLSEAVGDFAAAAAFFRAGLSHHPGHPMLLHLLSAASGESSFDVVLAADVLIYIGDLAELFEVVARAPVLGGVFAFSVELLAQGSYRLQSNGRYAHALTYLRSQAAAAGMSTVSIEPVDIRTERGGVAKGALLQPQRR
jgi:tetratricopeptide (TPR) repeat protein